MTTLYLIGGIAALVAALIFVAKRWGRVAAEKDVYEESHDKAVEARKIDDRVARLSDGDLDKRLRDG